MVVAHSVIAMTRTSAIIAYATDTLAGSGLLQAGHCKEGWAGLKEQMSLEMFGTDPAHINIVRMADGLSQDWLSKAQLRIPSAILKVKTGFHRLWRLRELQNACTSPAYLRRFWLLQAHAAVVGAQALVTVRLKADFPADKSASGLELSIPFPKEAARMTCEYEREPKPLGSQTWDWQERMHRLTWKLKRVQGGSDHSLKVCHLVPVPPPFHQLMARSPGWTFICVYAYPSVNPPHATPVHKTSCWHWRWVQRLSGRLNGNRCLSAH